MLSSRNILLALLSLSLGMSSCVKQQIVTPAFAEFTATAQSNTGSYFITDDPNSSFKIPLGITAAADKDRVVTFSVSSPSGATADQQYKLPGSLSVTIPAGKVIDSITVNGIYAGYDDGHTDTLIFTITGGDAKILEANSVYTLTLQRYCNVVLEDLKGEYDNCFDTQPGTDPSGPYTIIISDIVSTGPTTATATMEDFWGFGGTNTLKLDWTDPGNFKTILPSQLLIQDPSIGTVTMDPTGAGGFSSCANTFTVNYSISIDGGLYGNFTTIIAR